jgi:Bacterial Ig-like domain
VGRAWHWLRPLARVFAFASLVLLASCARKLPPSGGPPDLEPPLLVASSPDSGAARVPRDARIALTFSEGMEERLTPDAVSLAPRVEIKQRRWSGRTLTLVLADSLRANQTYTVFLGSGARDRHGNPLAGKASVVFSTADSLPPGTIDGTIDAKGFVVAGTYVWCYDAGRGHAPDSTARDFDAVGLADLQGHFRVIGLPVPARFRLWVFADLNGNRSFEPQTDILAPADTVIELTSDRPIASELKVHVVNPRAPGKVRGTVLDSLGIRGGPLELVAQSDADSLQRRAATVDEQGRFELELPAGVWWLRAFRDLDGNRAWLREREPASALRRVDISPAGEVIGVTLLLERPPSGP